MTLDWPALTRSLEDDGYALLPDLLDACRVQHWRRLAETPGAGLAPPEPGRGEWIATTGTSFADAYPLELAGLANRWNDELGEAHRYPLQGITVDAQLCRLEVGDYLDLRQGDGTALPLRIAILLSCPGQDFSGGEFVVTEQRPRMQSRATVLPLRQGDAVLFSTGRRPVRNSLGQLYGAGLKHGTSRVRSGQRLSLELGFPARH
ncbi:2OG-Fe(II) oxygenase [Pseudomonas sp. PDM13]|uniref:2OG-Fe(II) oxygenase n=1 Tax=Pseudomonas sp. PDM13 TaxID=2769255 RepID=UPI0021DFEAC4|nr:2OG-Fe(II) oxygenase [Pseudomonas sp. PDM13]MCU9946788.1 2OG-Fe(II) oxygenase [Pseudomonas sp. PDM13]